MDVPTLSRTLGIEERKVIRKAQEYARLISVKRPMGLGPSEICKSAVCLELAASEKGCEFNRDRAIQLSGSSSKVYQVAMSTMRTMLNIKSSLTAKQLAVQFGCLRLEHPTIKLLDEYKRRVLSKLHESRKKSIDFENPVYLIAAFYIQAKRLKINVEHSKLLEISSVSERQFLRMKQSIMEVCYGELLKREAEKKERLKISKLNRRGGNKKKVGVTIKFKQPTTNKIPSADSVESVEQDTQ